MIRFEMVNGDQYTARLMSIPDRLRAQLKQAMQKIVIDLQRQVVKNKLSGQVLNVVTNRLRSSITGRVEDTGTGISGIVGTNVPYGRVHEYGGSFTIPAHTRTSRLGNSYNVRSYTAHFPERSFMRTSLADLAGQIRADLEAAVSRGLR